MTWNVSRAITKQNKKQKGMQAECHIFRYTTKFKILIQKPRIVLLYRKMCPADATTTHQSENCQVAIFTFYENRFFTQMEPENIA